MDALGLTDQKGLTYINSVGQWMQYIKMDDRGEWRERKSHVTSRLRSVNAKLFRSYLLCIELSPLHLSKVNIFYKFLLCRPKNTSLD